MIVKQFPAQPRDTRGRIPNEQIVDTRQLGDKKKTACEPMPSTHPHMAEKPHRGQDAREPEEDV